MLNVVGVHVPQPVPDVAAIAAVVAVAVIEYPVVVPVQGFLGRDPPISVA